MSLPRASREPEAVTASRWPQSDRCIPHPPAQGPEDGCSEEAGPEREQRPLQVAPHLV